MQTLSFIPSEAGNGYEASFMSGESNVLQYVADVPGGRSNNIRVEARIDESMPWCLIKSLVGAPNELIVAIDVPSGLTVRLRSDFPMRQAGVSLG